jgi:hypothetical protein
MELQNIKKGEGALATMQNVRLELVIDGPWYVVYRKYPYIILCIWFYRKRGFLVSLPAPPPLSD